MRVAVENTDEFACSSQLGKDSGMSLHESEMRCSSAPLKFASVPWMYRKSVRF